MLELGNTRIINIEGADLYYSFLTNEKIKVKNSDTQFDERLSDIMPANLDLYFLESKGKLTRKIFKGEFYSFDIVNVSFEYKLLLDSKGKQIKNPKTASEIAKQYSLETIRKHVYTNGFQINGKKYVRYKRSSGSARSGSCLFIRSDLFTLMDQWSDAGLDKSICYQQLTSYEAYRALSLSSVISTLRLKPKNILFVDDLKVVLKNQKVIRVFEKGNSLDAEETIQSIENNIFDGEGLLDTSIFKETFVNKNGKTKNLANKGMMLLRNRFFKCCAFNTNLQQWFADNGIENINQLRGFVCADDATIKDIVLVVSKSCLKYVKMCKGGFNKENILKWCNNIIDDNETSLFGVVKTDKPTRFFDGDMVETTYQFLNSLQIKDHQMHALIAPYVQYVDYMRDIKNTPEFIRYFLEGEYKEIKEELDVLELDDSEFADEAVVEDLLDYTGYTFKNRICLELIKIIKEAKDTRLFKGRILRNIIDSLKLKLFNGRILVHGTYATLFGNPYEYLQYILNKNDINTIIENPLFNDGELYCSFFENGQEIVGSRAPHITMGNVLLAKNVKHNVIEKYFNLTKEIVVVDAIKNNIQHRLSGCDYDSDALLLTDNKFLVKPALLNYGRFLVPYSDFQSIEAENKLKTKSELVNELIRIDEFIAHNNVGAIVNQSQLLNSILWNEYDSKNFTPTRELYKRICILSALSGAEIDRAKRPFSFSSSVVLSETNQFINLKEDERKPVFYNNIVNEKHRKLKIGEIYKLLKAIEEDDNPFFKTSMDILWKLVNESGFDDTRTKDVDLIELFIQEKDNAGGKVYKQANEAIEQLIDIAKILSYKTGSKDKRKQFELEKANFRIAMENAYDNLKFKISTPQKAKIIINKINSLDDVKNENEEKNAKPSKYTLLFILLYIIYYHSPKIGYNIASLFPSDSKPLNSLTKTKDGEFVLFNKYRFSIKRTRRPKTLKMVEMVS